MWPLQANTTSRHFKERHIPNRWARLSFENISEVEQIFVGQDSDRGFDFGKAPHRVIAAIGDPLHSCFKHVAFYHKLRGGGRGIDGRLAQVIRQNARYYKRKELSNGKPRHVLAADPKRQQRTVLTVNGVIIVHADCPQLGQNW